MPIEANEFAFQSNILRLRKFGEPINKALRDMVTEYCAGGKIEENEMGGACGAYGGGERGAQGSGGET